VALGSLDQVDTSIYDNMADEDIVEEARTGDTQAMEYLIRKYKNFVKVKAKAYFLVGADKGRYNSRKA